MIKYYVEESLRCFQFWGDAKEFTKLLNGDELDIMDEVLGDVGGDLSDVAINDIFAYDREWVCECIGVNEDEIWERKVDE